MSENKKDCIKCLLYKNCKVVDIIEKNLYVLCSVLDLEYRYGTGMGQDTLRKLTFAKYCKLYCKDDIVELSLPSIEIIEKEI